MHVIAGLGNPGIEYEKSRHNAGFLALDALAARLSVRVTKKGFSGLYGEGIVRGERVLLVKPQTYMNLSGDCVQKILHFYKVPASNLTVMYDDIDLPLGALRIRDSGSAGTHNGMRSIVACVNTEAFPRIRIGMGRGAGGDLRDFVLGKPGKEEQALLAEVYAHAAEAAELILSGDIAAAQQRFNKKHEGLTSLLDKEK